MLIVKTYVNSVPIGDADLKSFVIENDSINFIIASVNERITETKSKAVAVMKEFQEEFRQGTKDTKRVEIVSN